MTVNPDFTPPTHDDVSDEIEDIMRQGNEKLMWARDMAKNLLEHAIFLEERSARMRNLAAMMILESQAFNDEIADLLVAEFPMEDG